MYMREYKIYKEYGTEFVYEGVARGEDIFAYHDLNLNEIPFGEVTFRIVATGIGGAIRIDGGDVFITENYSNPVDFTFEFRQTQLKQHTNFRVYQGWLHWDADPLFDTMNSIYVKGPTDTDFSVFSYGMFGSSVSLSRQWFDFRVGTNTIKIRPYAQNMSFQNGVLTKYVVPQYVILELEIVYLHY